MMMRRTRRAQQGQGRGVATADWFLILSWCFEPRSAAVHDEMERGANFGSLNRSDLAALRAPLGLVPDQGRDLPEADHQWVGVAHPGRSEQ